MPPSVRSPPENHGHDAWSCDILPTEIPGQHFQQDVIPLLKLGWDMMIGFPPCTRLSLSGARWCVDHWVKRKKGDRWHDGSKNRAAREDGAAFFRALWEAPIKRICLENPMSMASTMVAKRTQEIQPWQFGHGEKKTTWLWLKNLPPLQPTEIVEGREELIWKMTPSKTRRIDRARTFTGIASAMAAQWSNLDRLNRGTHGRS